MNQAINIGQSQNYLQKTIDFNFKFQFLFNSIEIETENLNQAINIGQSQNYLQKTIDFNFKFQSNFNFQSVQHFVKTLSNISSKFVEIGRMDQ